MSSVPSDVDVLDAEPYILSGTKLVTVRGSLRDIITNVIQLGFFITPIIYRIDTIDSRLLRALLRANPMTPFVIAYQDVLFFHALPSLSDSLLMLAYSIASLMLGFFVFERLRDTLAEAI